jgi:hypothetical protein
MCHPPHVYRLPNLFDASAYQVGPCTAVTLSPGQMPTSGAEGSGYLLAAMPRKTIRAQLRRDGGLAEDTGPLAEFAASDRGDPIDHDPGGRVEPAPQSCWRSRCRVVIGGHRWSVMS